MTELVYDRIDANRRRARLLLLLFGLISLPAVAWAVAYVALVVRTATAAMTGWCFFLYLGIDPLAVSRATGIGCTPLDAGGAGIWLAGALVGLTMWLQLRTARRLVLWRSGARPLGKREERGLHRAVENLAIGAGLPAPSVWLIDSPVPTAFATGLHPSEACVVVSRGLLDTLDPNELRAVLANLVVQIGNEDIRVSTLLSAMVSTLSLPARLTRLAVTRPFRLHPLVGLLGAYLLLRFLVMLLQFTGGETFSLALALGQGKVELYRLLFIVSAGVLPVYLLVVAPLLAELLRTRAIGYRKLLADGEAVLLTGDPVALTSARAKLSRETW